MLLKTYVYFTRVQEQNSSKKIFTYRKLTNGETLLLVVIFCPFFQLNETTNIRPANREQSDHYRGLHFTSQHTLTHTTHITLTHHTHTPNTHTRTYTPTHTPYHTHTTPPTHTHTHTHIHTNNMFSELVTGIIEDIPSPLTNVAISNFPITRCCLITKLHSVLFQTTVMNIHMSILRHSPRNTHILISCKI